MNVVDQSPRHNPKRAGATESCGSTCASIHQRNASIFRSSAKHGRLCTCPGNQRFRESQRLLPLSAALKMLADSRVYVRSRLDGRGAWATCNHLTTVAAGRLVTQHKRAVPKMDVKDFQNIVRKMMTNLPGTRLADRS